MFAVSIKRTADCLIGWLLAQVSETARKFSSNVMYIFNHQHRETTTDKKKQVYKDTHRHTTTHRQGYVLGHVIPQEHWAVCMSLFVLSLCLLICLPCCLAWGPSDVLPTISSLLYVCPCFFSLSAHLSVLSCLPISISMPQTVSHIKGTFLSALQIEKPHYISLFVLSAGDESKSGSFPLFYHSFIPLFASSTSVSPLSSHTSFLHFPSIWKTNHSVHLSPLPTSPIPHSLPPVSTVPQLLVLIATVSMWAGNITIPNERGSFFSFFSFLFIQHCVTFSLSLPAN